MKKPTNIPGAKNKCEGLSFFQIKKLKETDLQTCSKETREDLQKCKENIHTSKTHIVENGETLSTILGRSLFYNKKISINGKPPKYQPKISLHAGDTVTITGNECAPILKISLKKRTIVDMIIADSKISIKKLDKKELQRAKQNIARISHGVFSFADLMALAAKESSLKPNTVNGFTRIQKSNRPTKELRDQYHLPDDPNVKNHLTRDLEDATLHLMKYYKLIKEFQQSKEYKALPPTLQKLSTKELSLTAYNRGITNVLQILKSGHDPRTYKLPKMHQYYARKILNVSHSKEFQKILNNNS